MKSRISILGVILCLLVFVWLCIQRHSGKENHLGEEAPTTDTGYPQDLCETTTLAAKQWLHPRVKTIVNQSGDHAQRMNAVRLLPTNLSTLDHTALMLHISSQPDGYHDRYWHELVDGIICMLRCQQTLPSEITNSLVHLYNVSEDSVIKDYAIQHLRSLFLDRDDFYKHETDPNARKLILNTLVDAAGHTKDAYSGTALMALEAISSSRILKQESDTQTLISSQVDQLDEILVKAASSPETDIHCRISAMQLCAMRGLVQILPSVRASAQDTTENPNIRISAIAAIGQLGSMEKDGKLLKQLEGQGFRLSHATIPALEKLSHKQP